MTDIRNSDRCIIDSKVVSKVLWERIKPFMPENLYPEHKSLGINERLRFLRYDKGMYFKPHYDGAYYVPNSSPQQYTQVTL